jgi:hypothetical protein
MTFLILIVVWSLFIGVLLLADRDRENDREIERRRPPPPAPPSPCRSQEEVDEILRAWGNRSK